MRFKRFQRLSALAIGLCLAAVAAAAPAWAAGASPDAPDSPDPYALESPVTGAPLLAAPRAGEIAGQGYCGAEGEGKNLTWTLDSEGTLTIEGSGAMADYSYISPAPWDGCKDSIRRLVVNSGVTSIGDDAFYGCTGLASVSFPDSLKSIGDSAFCNCALAGELTIPEGVTEIGQSAFSRNSSTLTGVTLPDSLTSIGDQAFAGCSFLASINFTSPASSMSIGDGAFSSCSRLASVSIPEGVEVIGDSAFERCTALTSVTLPASLTSIGQSAFEMCSAIKSFTVADGNPVYSSQDGLLLNKNKMELIACLIPPEDGTLTVPGGVEIIGDSAFYGCSGLASVELPASLTSIGDKAFQGCENLASAVIPGGVKTIGSLAFENCPKLASVTLPASLTSIGQGAFSSCSRLASVSIPEGVEAIGDNAFNGCTALASINFTSPASLTSIGDYAFYNCSGLTSVTLPEGVEAIGGSAFYGCSGLTSVTLPASLTSIGQSAFEMCSAIKSFTVADGNPVYSSQDGLLLNKNKTELIACLVRPDGPLTVPGGVEIIGDYAFYGCSGLASVELPEGVETIGDYAFYGCSGLASVTLPASLTSIGRSAFERCSGLKTVVYNGTADQLADLCGGNLAAAGFPGNQTFSYPVAVENGGDGASVTEDHDYGTTVTLNAGTREHHTFTGWTVSGTTPANLSDTSKSELTFTMPGGPVTASANWKLNSHAVTVANGGDGASVTEDHDYGTTVTLAAGTREHHTFTGWTVTGVTLTEAQRKANPLTFTMPDGPVTASANWALPSASGVSQTGSTVKLTFPGAAPADGARVLAALDGAAALSGTYDAAGSEVRFQRPLEKGRKLFFLDPDALIPLAMPAVVG